MPKFVPVVDSETPLSEQAYNDPNYEKHRQFDAPYVVKQQKSDVIDRGWKQGSLGWGVLGSFGSSNKDSSAQVINRSEGASKMVKNEKGLWVKQKETRNLNEQNSSRGRGKGIISSALGLKNIFFCLI